VKKGIVALIIALALIVLISPGIVGMLAEKSVDEQIERATAKNQDLVITAERFDRGWFSSQGRHRIELQNSNNAASVRDLLGLADHEPLPALIVDTNLNHGPIALASVGGEDGPLAPGLGNAVSTLSIEMPDGELVALPGTVNSSLTLAGDLSSNYAIPAGSQDIAIWGDISIDFESKASNGAYAYDGLIESLNIDDKDGGVALSNLSFSGDLAMSEFDFAVGNVKLALDTMSFGSGATSSLSIGPVALDASSEINGDRIDTVSELSVTIDDIPNVGQVGLDTKLAIEGVDGEALGRLVQRLESVQSSGNTADMLSGIENELLDVLAAGAKMRVEHMNIALPQGTIKSAMNIKVLESDSADFAWTSLLLALEADAQFEIPEIIANMAMMMAPEAGFVEGFLKKNGDVYELEAAYKKGLLTVNGVPLPMPVQ